jgi:hypothetical protein
LDGQPGFREDVDEDTENVDPYLDSVAGLSPERAEVIEPEMNFQLRHHPDIEKSSTRHSVDPSITSYRFVVCEVATAVWDNDMLQLIGTILGDHILFIFLETHLMRSICLQPRYIHPFSSVTNTEKVKVDSSVDSWRFIGLLFYFRMRTLSAHLSKSVLLLLNRPGPKIRTVGSDRPKFSCYRSNTLASIVSRFGAICVQENAFLEMVIGKVRESISVACYGFKEVAVLSEGQRIGYDPVSELNEHFDCHPFVRTQRLEYEGKAFKFDETVGYHEAISGRLWPAARLAISSLQTHCVPFNILLTARQCNIDLIRHI